jgi:hypothetical protein
VAEVEAASAAARALVDDLGDRRLALGGDLDAAAAVLPGPVLSRVEGDDVVRGLVGPPAGSESVLVPGEGAVVGT